jgi:hypothetical protein
VKGAILPCRGVGQGLDTQPAYSILRGAAVQRLVQVAVAAALACSVVACAMLDRQVSTGPCELVVSRVSPREGDVVVEPPYETTMYFRPSGDEARIKTTGTGWGETRVTVDGPGKALDVTVEGESMNDTGDWILPKPGKFHFSLTSDQCTRRFDVTVKPRP